MTTPTITLVMKGDTGDEIVDYGYVSYKGDQVTIKTGVRLTKTTTEYVFPIRETKLLTNLPKAAWVRFTNDRYQPSIRYDRNVRMQGLRYNDIDVWDPTYGDWPGNDNPPNNRAAINGNFLWNGTYRMGINPKKLPAQYQFGVDTTTANPTNDPFKMGNRSGVMGDEQTKAEVDVQTQSNVSASTTTKETQGTPMWVYLALIMGVGLLVLLLMR